MPTSCVVTRNVSDDITVRRPVSAILHSPPFRRETSTVPCMISGAVIAVGGRWGEMGVYPASPGTLMERKPVILLQHHCKTRVEMHSSPKALEE